MHQLQQWPPAHKRASSTSDQTLPHPCDTAGRYHTRPLAMSPRSKVQVPSERPNTSSGSGSGKPLERPDFSKRTSRDDLALSNGKLVENSNSKSYHIPIRGRLPTPEGSPTGQDSGRQIVVRTSTPESFGEVTETGVIAIGMALGSPTQPPATAVTPWHTHEASISVASETILQDPPVELPARTKSRRWGLFGRSKSKRAKNLEVRPQRSMTDSTVSTPADFAIERPGRGNVLPQPSQEPRKTPKHKPIIIRSQTEPVVSRRADTEVNEAPMRLAAEPVKRPEHPPRQDSLEKRQNTSPVPSLSQENNGRLLDVNIPSIEMERYSVMFGEVLRPQSASALLARRQATLTKLKTISDQEEQRVPSSQPQRSKTTYSHQRKSPSFSLFPTTPGKSESSARLTPHLRCNTSPALLPSPVQETFVEQNQERENHLGRAYEQQPLRAPQKDDTEARQLKSKFYNQGHHPIHRRVDQANETADHSNTRAEAHIKDKLRPTLTEPKWQMVCGPEPTASPSLESKRRPRNLSSPIPNNTPKDPESSADKALRDAVQISIARQISISRQQHRLLLPLQNATPRVRRNPTVAGPGTSGVTVTVGQDERLAETKMSTPVVIHPEADAAKAPKSNHRYHKSEQAILERA